MKFHRWITWFYFPKRDPVEMTQLPRTKARIIRRNQAINFLVRMNLPSWVPPPWDDLD